MFHITQKAIKVRKMIRQIQIWTHIFYPRRPDVVAQIEYLQYISCNSSPKQSLMCYGEVRKWVVFSDFTHRTYVYTGVERSIRFGFITLHADARGDPSFASTERQWTGFDFKGTLMSALWGRYEDRRIAPGELIGSNVTICDCKHTARDCNITQAISW